MYSKEKLLEMLSSDKASVRYEACERLRVSKESSPQIVIALDKATLDEDKDIAESAILALSSDVHYQMAVKMGMIEPDETEEGKQMNESPNMSGNNQAAPHKESLHSVLAMPHYWLSAVLPFLCILASLSIITLIISNGSGWVIDFLFLPFVFGFLISFLLNYFFPFVSNIHRALYAMLPLLILSIIFEITFSQDIMYAEPHFGIIGFLLYCGIFLIFIALLIISGWLGAKTSKFRYRWWIFGTLSFACLMLLFVIIRTLPIRCLISISSRASPENQSTFTSETDEMPLVYVPAGEFLMGSDNGLEDQKPLHQVYLDAYWIDQHEVTNMQYAKCVTAGVCDNPTFSDNPYYFDPDKADYPLEGVFWSDADAYCKWAGRRLPTEAEWEKAARGTDGRTYPWGNTLPTRNLLNFNGSWDGTTPVGCYSPAGDSPYGVWDMSGNVYEWVNDRYQFNYYAVSPTSNPQGPDNGDERVVRGSDFNDFENDVRATHRYGSDPSWWHSGFRCAVSP